MALSVVAGAALAQTAAPLSSRDVAGNWALAITPAERPGLQIDVDSTRTIFR